MNPYVLVNTKLITRMQEVYQSLCSNLFGLLNKSLVLFIDKDDGEPVQLTYDMLFNSG